MQVFENMIGISMQGECSMSAILAHTILKPFYGDMKNITKYINLAKFVIF